MESVMIANELEVVNLVKIEMDNSYAIDMEKTEESGVFSNESGDINGSDSRDSSWNFWKNEIVDPDTFDPPILQSTNLRDVDGHVTCELSTVSDSKGKIYKFPNACIKIYTRRQNLQLNQDQ